MFLCLCAYVFSYALKNRKQIHLLYLPSNMSGLTASQLYSCSALCFIVFVLCFCILSDLVQRSVECPGVV
jgi:hypothetical protein